MCLYICVCTMLRVLICQGVYYFMCLYICVYYVKSVSKSRSLLFHVFIYCVNVPIIAAQFLTLLSPFNCTRYKVGVVVILTIASFRA